MRSSMIKAERDNLLEARMAMRKQADLQKQQMMETFEKMKLKGKVNVSIIVMAQSNYKYNNSQMS